MPERSPGGFRTFLLFRHGETAWNAEGRFQGHTDIPLNEVGRAQSRRLAGLLAPRGLDLIASSDLCRATETADLVAEARLGRGVGGLTPRRIDPRLREACLGQAEGLPYDEVARRLGEEAILRWRSGHPRDLPYAYPDGESGHSVLDRVAAALTALAAETPPGSRIAVATHGGVIRRVLQRLRPDDREALGVHNTVCYELILDEANLAALSFRRE